jgi:hypothetical protein
MDNKQDRQFYWEVKDFLGKNNQSNSSKVSKPESLKECISKTIIKNDALYRPSIIPPAPLTEDIISSVNSLLSLTENHIKHSSNNITTNLFNLTEAPARAFGGGSLSGGASGRSFDSSRRSGSSWRERNPEEYQQNVEMRLARQREAEENRRKVATDSQRRRAEDETYQYGQAMKDAGSDAQLEMDSTRPGIAADTAANRAKLQSWRDEKDREKRATSIAKTIETLSGKDPASLTSKEASELQMAKIYMGGGQYSKGDASLEGRVKDKLTNSQALKNKAEALQGPTPDGGNVTDSFATPDAAMKSTLGRSVEDLAQTTQTAFSREAAIKRQEDKAFDDRVKEERYQSMKDKVVQGTNMTYGEFEAKTGRRFNATDARDSSLISNLAGAGSRGRSEQAKQLDLTTDQFNSRYAEQNKDLAQRQGTADRAYDQSQFESDKFKNDPAYRKQVRDAETAKLMPQVKAQIAADEAKRVAAETAGREQAKRDKEDKITKANLEKSSKFAGSLNYNPSTTTTPKPAEDFISYKPKEDNITPYRTKADKDAADALKQKEIETKSQDYRYQPGISKNPALAGPPSPEYQYKAAEIATKYDPSYEIQRDLEQPIRDFFLNTAAEYGFGNRITPVLDPNEYFESQQKARGKNLATQVEYNDYVIQKKDADKAARSRGLNPSALEPVQSFDEWKQSKQKQASDASFANQPRPEFTQNASAPNEYVSLINSFTSPKVGREPIEPGSKQDVDRQLKRLRGGQ